MKMVYGFCLRFFCSFVAAKLLLRSLGTDSAGYLLGLSLLFTLNLYWFDLSKYSDRFSPGRSWIREQKNKNDDRPQYLPPAKTDQ